jgi:hypothetical protein
MAFQLKQSINRSTLRDLLRYETLPEGIDPHASVLDRMLKMTAALVKTTQTIKFVYWTYSTSL